jgi:hypothetical protein
VIARGRLARAVGAVLVLAVSTACGSARETVLRALHADYAETAAALVRQGRPAEALDALEAATLLDEPRVRMLDRMAHRAREAGAASPALARLGRLRARDAELRARIGQALLVQIGDGRQPGERQRALLERASANAAALAWLEPDAARTHFLRGMLELLRGRGSGSAGAYARAASALEHALALEPAYPGAARALDEAKRHSGV